MYWYSLVMFIFRIVMSEAFEIWINLFSDHLNPHLEFQSSCIFRSFFHNVLTSLLFDSYVNTIGKIKHFGLAHTWKLPFTPGPCLLCFTLFTWFFFVPVVHMQPRKILFLTAIMVDHMYKSFTIIKTLTDFVITLIKFCSRTLEPHIHVAVIWPKTPPEHYCIQIKTSHGNSSVVFLHHTVPQSGL